MEGVLLLRGGEVGEGREGKGGMGRGRGKGGRGWPDQSQNCYGSDIEQLSVRVAVVESSWCLATQSTHRHLSTSTASGKNDRMRRANIMGYVFIYFFIIFFLFTGHKITTPHRNRTGLLCQV